MYLKSQNSFLAALYMRLSKDDGDKVESDSIRNQRSLLRDFVKQHSDITLVKEYVLMLLSMEVMEIHIGELELMTISSMLQ